MKRIAWLTTNALPAFSRSTYHPYVTPDDVWGLRAVQAAGADVQPVVWHSVSDEELRSFDLALIRSPWDYMKRPAAFFTFLDRLETLGVPVYNPLPVVRQNLDKRYLLELAARGVVIPETVVSETHSPLQLADYISSAGLTEIVVKPVVSAGGWRTRRLDASAARAFQPEFTAWHVDGPILVQSFVPEILNEGEWSLTFFDGVYSHAVLKKAQKGDFRVQDDYGGLVAFCNPPARLIAAATAALVASGDLLLYARVDGVWAGGRFILMEVELIEPELFFRADQSAALRFVDTILLRLA